MKIITEAVVIMMTIIIMKETRKHMSQSFGAVMTRCVAFEGVRARVCVRVRQAEMLRAFCLQRDRTF